jgi:hypothetical protein
MLPVFKPADPLSRRKWPAHINRLSDIVDDADQDRTMPARCESGVQQPRRQTRRVVREDLPLHRLGAVGKCGPLSADQRVEVDVGDVRGLDQAVRAVMDAYDRAVSLDHRSERPAPQSQVAQLGIMLSQ